MSLQDAFETFRRDMNGILVERDNEIECLLTALVAQENFLMVSPPGCAKTLLLDSLMSWMGGKKFSMLITKYSVPEELFGPISIRGLKEDKFTRITTGKMPEADFCYLDELFKGSSAILNTILRIINEKVFDNGGGLMKVPLKLCMASSNEFPNEENGGKELNALFDRFLIRKTVKPIKTQEGREKLLFSSHEPKLTGHITPAELDQARAEADVIPFGKEAKDALFTILKELNTEGIYPGDRRLYKSVRVAKASAWLGKAAEVKPDHLEILSHVLWDDPQEQPDKCARIVAKVANPTGLAINELLIQTEEILAGVDQKNLSSAAAATKKLGEIGKKLEELKGGNGRLEKAKAYIREQVKAIKLASLENL